MTSRFLWRLSGIGLLAALAGAACWHSSAGRAVMVGGLYVYLAAGWYAFAARGAD